MSTMNSEEKAALLHKRIRNGLKEVFESGSFSDYLKIMSRFHTYSVRNTLLILMANPNATLVAGYKAWSRNFNRYVKKGERGIPIFAYTPSKQTVEKELTDSSGKITVKKEEVIVPAYKVVYVFDISQTSGAPLPEPVKELRGKVDNYTSLLNSLRIVSPFPIEIRLIDGAKGFCDPDKKQIIVNTGMSEQQTVKTIIHEMVHAIKHVQPSYIPSGNNDRSVEEIEAECVAFVVCEHYGIDTSEYSFPYIAAWSRGKELDDLLEICHSIQQLAEEIIDKIDNPRILKSNSIRSSQCSAS